MTKSLVRFLMTLSLVTGSLVAKAGTEAEWSGPAEPHREIASESLEDTLRSWDRDDYRSNLTEEQRIDREVTAANGPVMPKHAKAATHGHKSISKKSVRAKSASKKIGAKNAKKIAKKSVKSKKSTKKSVALNGTRRFRR